MFPGHPYIWARNIKHYMHFAGVSIVVVGVTTQQPISEHVCVVITQGVNPSAQPQWHAKYQWHAS